MDNTKTISSFQEEELKRDFFGFIGWRGIMLNSDDKEILFLFVKKTMHDWFSKGLTENNKILMQKDESNQDAR